MKPIFKKGQKVLFRGTSQSSVTGKEMKIAETALVKSISLFTGETVSSYAYLCTNLKTGRQCHLLERELVKA